MATLRDERELLPELMENIDSLSGREGTDRETRIRELREKAEQDEDSLNSVLLKELCSVVSMAYLESTGEEPEVVRSQIFLAMEEWIADAVYRGKQKILWFPKREQVITDYITDPDLKEDVLKKIDDGMSQDLLKIDFLSMLKENRSALSRKYVSKIREDYHSAGKVYHDVPHAPSSGSAAVIRRLFCGIGLLVLAVLNYLFQMKNMSIESFVSLTQQGMALKIILPLLSLPIAGFGINCLLKLPQTASEQKEKMSCHEEDMRERKEYLRKYYYHMSSVASDFQRALRFYELWFETENCPVPKEFQEDREVLIKAMELYWEIVSRGNIF